MQAILSNTCLQKKFEVKFHLFTKIPQNIQGFEYVMKVKKRQPTQLNELF